MGGAVPRGWWARGISALEIGQYSVSVSVQLANVRFCVFVCAPQESLVDLDIQPYLSAAIASAIIFCLFGSLNVMSMDERLAGGVV